MSVTAHEIETIVRAVLQRLRGHASISVEAASGTTAAAAALPTPVLPTPAQPAAGELKLPTSPITLDSLRGQLDGITSVHVARRAVVTPAAADELRQRGIQLLRVQPQPHNPATVPALIVVAAAPALSQLNAFGDALSFTALPEADNVQATLTSLADSLARAPQARIVWLTQQPFAAAASAYGVAGLRTVQLARAEQLKQAIREVSPNLLILDSGSWKNGSVAQLLRGWQGDMG